MQLLDCSSYVFNCQFPDNHAYNYITIKPVLRDTLFSTTLSIPITSRTTAVSLIWNCTCLRQLITRPTFDSLCCEFKVAFELVLSIQVHKCPLIPVT